MNFANLETHLSTPRLSRYLLATNGNKKKVIKAYKLNLELAQAFHPLLGFLEVVLRNNINNELSKFWSDSNWIINQKTIFAFDVADDVHNFSFVCALAPLVNNGHIRTQLLTEKSRAFGATDIGRNNNEIVEIQFPKIFY